MCPVQGSLLEIGAGFRRVASALRAAAARSDAVAQAAVDFVSFSSGKAHQLKHGRIQRLPVRLCQLSFDVKTGSLRQSSKQIGEGLGLVGGQGARVR